MNEPVELHEAVLHRCGRKEQHVTGAPAERFDEVLAAPSTRAGELVDFVDDDEIPRVARQTLRVDSREVQADDQLVNVEPISAACSDSELFAELLLQLFGPLVSKRRWADHQHPPSQAPHDELLGDKARLDCLSESDFVGQESSSM